MSISMRLNIQKKLIETVTSYNFPIIQYGKDRLPYLYEVGSVQQYENPTVLTNSVGFSPVQKSARGSATANYALDNWSFDMIISFKHEVDVTEFFMTLPILTEHSNDGRLIIIKPSAVLEEHSMMQGGTGTKVKATFIAQFK